MATQPDSAFQTHRKTTRRDVFLAEMDKVVPWSALCAVIEPFYPSARAEGGRSPVGLERMLRIHFVQQWYALSDPAVEEVLNDLASMRRFVDIDLGCVLAPDETMVRKELKRVVRHLDARDPKRVDRDSVSARIGAKPWVDCASTGFDID